MEKTLWSAIGGLCGGFIAMAFGVWSELLTLLVLLMCADYITGLVVAAVFKASPKSSNGGLESRAGLKGLIRKVCMLTLVMIAHHIDLALGIEYIMNFTICGFITNEGLSLVENAGLMGLKIPDKFKNAFDLLQDDDDEDEHATDVL